MLISRECCFCHARDAFARHHRRHRENAQQKTRREVQCGKRRCADAIPHSDEDETHKIALQPEKTYARRRHDPSIRAFLFMLAYAAMFEQS